MSALEKIGIFTEKGILRRVSVSSSKLVSNFKEEIKS
jgi:hypothetical protein